MFDVKANVDNREAGVKRERLTEGESVIMDIIRVLLSQVVLIGHAVSYFQIANFMQPPYIPALQSVAVVCFFILSGFVISYTVFMKKSCNSYDFSQFFIDRFSRIYSAYVPALIVVFIIDGISRWLSVDLYTYESAYSVSTFMANLFMLQEFPNYFFGYVTYFNQFSLFGSGRPFWTLAIEWWSYMLFGFLVLKAPTLERHTFFYSVILLLLLIVPFYHATDTTGVTVYWVYGIIVCLVYPHYKAQNFSLKFNLFMALAFFALAARRAGKIEAYDALLAFFMAGLFLVILNLFSQVDWSKKIKSVVKFMANYSFSLFLVHYSVLDLLYYHYVKPGILGGYSAFVIGFVLSNLIALVLGVIFEVKLTKIVRRWLTDWRENIEKKRA